MIKSATTKLTRLLGLLISLILICLVNACGNSAETSATGEAVTGVHISSFTGSPTSLAAGQSSVLTVNVTDTSGKPVLNATVNFRFTNNSSGATLTSVGGRTGTKATGTTDSNGQAMVIYKAGTTSSASALEDTVSASCLDSQQVLIISCTANSVALYNIKLTSSSTNVSAGKSSIVTATVTDGTGVPVSGQAINFTFAANNSGATITILGTGTTDSSGISTAVYKAGTNNPDEDVYDNIQASITGSMGTILITRLAGGASGIYMDLTADNTSLAAGESTIITATVKDGGSNPISGKTVAFDWITNNSGGSLTGMQGTTDVNGKATALYTAGSNSPSVSVQDTLKASITGGSTKAIIINRTVSSSTALRMALTAEKTTVAAGESTIITATITNSSGTAVAGQTVTFGFVPGGNLSGASLTPLNNVTDASGEATVLYTAGSLTAATVEDIVQASITGLTKAIIITKSGTSASATANSLDISALPTSIKTDGSTTSTITVNALNSLNAAISGVVVTVGTDTGVLSASTVTTPGTLTLSSGGNKINRTATITATAGAVTAQIPVQITGSYLSLTSSATSLPNDGSSTATLTVVAKDAGNNTVPGAAVTLTQSGTGSVTFSSASGTTNASGKFTTTVTGSTNDMVTITATGLGTTATTVLTVTPVSSTFQIDQLILNGGTPSAPPSDKTTSMKIGDNLNVEVNAPAGITQVTFATTIGLWDSTATVVTKTVAGGKANATLTTAMTGVANIQVYDKADAGTKDTLIVAMSSGAAPNKIFLQASPTIVPVSVGTTTGSSTITATVYDSANNPLGGQSVAFSIVNPTSGGETVSPVVVMTATTTSGGLSLGQARTSFTSGSMASGAGGINIHASVVGTAVQTGVSPSGNDAAIVIGGTAGSIAFGQATVVGTDDSKANYVWPMSILVADSNGNAVAGAVVSLSVWPIAWSTGITCSYDPDGCRLNSASPPVCVPGGYGTFWNEDINENLILDAGEDGKRVYYANNIASPFAALATKDGYITPTNSYAGALPATVTTDSNGVAAFNLTYPKQSAIWTVDRIRATTHVQGSETRGELILRLPPLKADVDPDCFLGSSPYQF